MKSFSCVHICLILTWLLSVLDNFSYKAVKQNSSLEGSSQISAVLFNSYKTLQMQSTKHKSYASCVVNQYIPKHS